MHILPSIYRESIHFFEQSFLRELTSQQKKISAIAFIAFSCLAACYALYYCCFKTKKDVFEPLKEPHNLPSVSLAAEKKYQQGITKFSFEVFQEMIGESTADNLIISPMGISLLLAMIKHGVGEEEQGEIERILHLPQDENELKVNAFKLIKKLKEQGLELASLLYLNDKYRLNSDYQSQASEYYQSKVERGSSAKEVNAWVKKATNGQIQEIISQQDLVDFFLVLANALHFKADWQEPFAEEETNLSEFYTPNGSIQTEMMHAVNNYQWFENDKCQSVILEYKDKDDVLMVLILPKKDNDFSSIKASLFEDIFGNSQPEMVKIAVPKFKNEQEVDVKELLTKMEVNGLFRKPDFTPLVDVTHGPTKNALPNLRISKIAQKSLLAFNEKGTEASSATAAVMVKECCQLDPKYSKEINFNRPFFVALIAKEAPILFGVVRNPSN